MSARCARSTRIRSSSVPISPFRPPPTPPHPPHASVAPRAVGGHDKLAVDMVQHRLRGDDIFLLCSDGLTKMLEDREIATLLGGDRPIEIAVEMLLDAALDRGATDNVTVVGVQLLSTAESHG